MQFQYWPGPLENGLKWLEFVKYGFMAYNIQKLISNMLGTLFLLTWGPIMENFKISHGIFQTGVHQAQVLQASQAGRGSTQFPGEAN